MSGKRVIDLRSDTVTRPTPAMREAMARADVGDDVFSEDPTVNRLERVAAERLGREAGLFLPSGTMGNLVAIMVQTRPGDEVLVEERGHSMRYELGGMAAFAGVLARPVHGEDGVLTPELIAPLIRRRGVSWSGTGLLVLENTHNMAGGIVTPLPVVDAVTALARDNGVPVHLDGARLFNAAIALGVPPARLAEGCQSVMFCLSKGLGAPVGSMLVGCRELVSEARQARKRLGGGMRQAGVIAAAGMVALGSMVDRLSEDHANARRLAEGLAELSWIDLDVATVQTNIVIFRLRPDGPAGAELVERLEAEGVRSFAPEERQVRMVTHYDVTTEDIDATLEAVRRVGPAS